MSGNPVGVDNTSWRKFDKEEYARQRERQEKVIRASTIELKIATLRNSTFTPDIYRGPPVQRQLLKHRHYEVDLESRLGKTQVVTPIAPLSQQAGYYCSVCECVVKDLANYLDHINGKKYQRALGMSMRVERASLEQIWMRENTETTAGGEEAATQRKEEREEKRTGCSHEPEEIDPDIAAMMGFGGFGSSKK
ncbi:hypothetical protein QOZ80_1BG0084700 [Eleusine coracana subsp. coracana]|nr:hypothetical protein QOZ80_1BG0084700 [Eleusine coracana subsp. coracana]